MSVLMFSRHNADHVNYLSSGSEHEKEFPVGTDEKLRPRVVRWHRFCRHFIITGWGGTGKMSVLS